MRKRIGYGLVLAFAMTLCGQAPLAQVDARMLRQPDVSRDRIAFVYAGDIWVVSKEGGNAERLSSPGGEETLPRFSPDGSQIAFTADYDGNDDIYVISSGGGIPTRITHHPEGERVLDWYPDGRSILFASPMESGRDRFNRLYKTTSVGGLPERLPVAYGEFGTISDDGKLLAYTPQTRDYRTWKRYRGGWAPDIWVFDLAAGTAKNVTNSPANDTQPMWHGRTLYYLSDRGPEGRFNIWAYDLDSGKTRQVTKFTDFDIHFPGGGPSDIVFEMGGRIHLLDLKTEKTHPVDIKIVTDNRTLLPRIEKVEKLIANTTVSPTGKRAVVEARGELFSLPAEHGVVRNMTASSGSAERFPALSPDGKELAYWSDASGEYELYVRPADGSGEAKALTKLGPGFRYCPYWSPDSKKIAFVDQVSQIRVLDRESGEVKKIDEGQWMSDGASEQFTFSWSADSRWLAYTKELVSRRHVIALYDLEKGEVHNATSGYYDDYTPVFDPDGKYLYYFSERTFNPAYSNLDNSWVYANTTNILAVPLRKDVESPLAPRNDEEKPKKEEEGKEDKGKEEKGEKAADSGQESGSTESEEGKEAKQAKDSGESKKSVEIDLDGFENRAVILPPAGGNYSNLAAVAGKVVYIRRPRTGSPRMSPSPLVFYDLKEREEMTVLDDIDGFDISADGKKVLVNKDGSLAIVDLKPKQKIEKKLRTAELEMTVDPKAEWRQIFQDAWRFERDFFYDPNMHGVNWDAIRSQYGKLLEDAVTRWDVNFVLGEMIAELNASHSYRGGGDTETKKRVSVGLLGVDWAIDNGAYRIKRIVHGAPWDDEERSPLDEPGVNVKEGDYVLAVNGVPIDTKKDPWAAFQGLGDQAVSLTVNDSPSREGSREVVVHTKSGEDSLRYLDWIEQSRRRVEEATKGRVGYIYVPSTGRDGQTELVRQFMAQFTKEGLIVDERFNSGGQIPDRFIELLNRPALAFWAVRNGQDWQWPPVANFGPKVMLINGWSGSGGDAFPYYFKEAGLGPLIGSRTWGGLIGVSGAPGLIDGGGVTVPTFRMYSPQGEWFKEGHGVDPDIPVPEDPAQLAKGVDTQLERAIQEVLRLLEKNPPAKPNRPPYEDRSAPPSP